MSDFIQAVRLESPATIPVSVGILPAAWMHYGAELQHYNEPDRFYWTDKRVSRCSYANKTVNWQ